MFIISSELCNNFIKIYYDEYNELDNKRNKMGLNL